MNTTPQLRPMSLGDLFDTAFRLYREHFVTFVGIVALLQVPLAIVQFMIQVLVSIPALNAWMRASAQLQNARRGQNIFDILPIGQFFSAVAITGGINLILSLIIGALITGALANAIARGYLSQPISILTAYHFGARRYGALLLASLIGLGVTLGVMALIGGCLFGAMTAYPASGSNGLLVGVLVIGLLLFVFLFIPAIIFFTVRFLLTIQAIVLEGKGPLAGLGRSWRLVQGSFWRVLGIVVLLNLLIYIIAGIPATLVSLALTLGSGDPLNNLVRNQAITTLVTQIGVILAQPIALSIYTLLYYDLRVRKEGYDIEVMAQQTVAT
jgi:Membrane domain of glycerophosphoryl diester phosphodiesterase